MEQPAPNLTGLPVGTQPAVALDRCFDAQYGLQIVADHLADSGGLHARVAVADRNLGPTGVVHGGVYASIAEALAARGTIKALDDPRHVVVGMSNDTRFLRPISRGAINSHARLISRGDDLWLWDVEHRDDEERLCALTRMTIAVR
jgi:uncharacterized protein (TIGR00369 family)